MSNPEGPSHSPADPPAWGQQPAGGWGGTPENPSPGTPAPDDERTQTVDPRSWAPPQQPPHQQYGAAPGQPPSGNQPYAGQPYPGQPYGSPQPTQPFPGGAHQYPGQQGWPPQGPPPTQQWGPGHPPLPAPRGRSKLPLILGGVGILVVAAILVLGFVAPAFFVSKVFDTAAVQTGVQKILTDSYGVKDVTAVTCGRNIAVTAGNTFTCDATIAGKPARVPVRITSNDGNYEVGRPA